MSCSRRVTLGRIAKPQGLKGEVRVSLSGSSLELFEGCGRMTAIRKGLAPRELSLESVHPRNRFVVAKFDGVSDRSAAESLVGCELQVPEDRIPKLPPGEYYTFQLEGLEVVDESGELIGTLEEVLDLPAHDVYVVRREGREMLLPAMEEVVRRVDLETGRVVVRIPEGLLDEEER